MTTIDETPIENAPQLTAEIVKIYPTECWYEKDWCGTVHVKLQHHGMQPFTFIQIHYDYMYTSNGHQFEMVKDIGKLLGYENIEQRPYSGGMDLTFKKEPL